MKKQIEVWEGKVTLDSGSYCDDPSGYVIGGESIDSIIDSFEGKEVRLTIEVIG